MAIVTDCTESQVQARIMLEKQSSSKIMVPNYTPATWWENDLFQVTKAGYWVEFEIKRSISDYRADFKKSSSWVDGQKKHDLLEAGEGEFVFDPYTERPNLKGKHFQFP